MSARESTPIASSRRMLSIVSPVFNERELVSEFVDRCVAAARSVATDFELIIVDDRSTDDTADRILDRMREYPGVIRLVQLSRNFGQQAAFHAGLAQVAGDVVVTLDSDLQDPPELIQRLVETLDEGFDIVLARRVNPQGGSWGASGHTGLKSVGAFLFHKWISKLRMTPMRRDVGEYRCMRRPVVDHLLGFSEHMLFVPGLVAYIGLEAGFVPYVRRPRRRGAPTSITRLTTRALDTLTAFSIAPLNLVLIVSAVAWVLPFLLAVWLAIAIWRGSSTAGTMAVVLAALTAWCVTLSVLGILAHYLGRVFLEVKRRPRYFVRRILEKPDARE